MFKIPKQEYTAEFKELVVKRAQGGEGIAKVARELGLVEQTLRNWVKAAKSGKLNPPGTKAVTPEQMELSRVRAELARLKMENEILKKATVGSTGRCNTIYPDLDLEGGEYGSNGETRAFRIPEGGAVATMESRTVFERHRSCTQQACRVGAWRCVIEWRHRSCSASSFSSGTHPG
jgi:transposase